MKTNPLKVLAFALILSGAEGARALDVFECVRDLMPISEQSAFQSRRNDVEKPFMLNDKFMVFPEVAKGEVTGFYIYSHDHANYYDSVEIEKTRKSLPELRASNPYSLFSLVAQPLGLETVIVQFMPAYGVDESVKDGPIILGSSVMPVVGALMSRTNEQLRMVYHNPAESDEADLKKWISEHSKSRRPARAGALELDKRIVRLATRAKKGGEELWAPLKGELSVRKKWVQEHNLDEGAFRRLSWVMETNCKP